MKSFATLLACALSLVSGTSIADPITRIASLSPRYNSEVLEIRWESAVTGGCTTSDFAVSNATAANSRNVTAFLLAAFSAGLSVEVVFGGGCDQGSNWIQTIRLVQ